MGLIKDYQQFFDLRTQKLYGLGGTKEDYLKLNVELCKCKSPPCVIVPGLVIYFLSREWPPPVGFYWSIGEHIFKLEHFDYLLKIPSSKLVSVNLTEEDEFFRVLTEQARLKPELYYWPWITMVGFRAARILWEYPEEEDCEL
jgi:hypothetical protein